jgi:putative acyl-CoA dehydrogenase
MSWRTHDVFNQFSELSGYNLFTTDRALTEALGRCANWSSDRLTTFGASLGSAETYALADNANRHKPELQIFDARGRRIDFVDFHPS